MNHFVWSLWCRDHEENETLAVDDLYPTPYSGPVIEHINYIYISDDYAYYAGMVTNQDDKWTLLGTSYYAADLKNGEITEIYYLTDDDTSDKSTYNRMIGEYGDYLIFAQLPFTHSLVIDEDGVVMVKKEEFLSGKFSWNHFYAEALIDYDKWMKGESEIGKV